MHDEFLSTLPRRLRLLAVLALGLCALGCSSTSSSARVGADARGWLEPSPALRQQIEDEAKRLPWTHGLERVELIHWFARVGEPAYPTLLDMVLDPRKDVAGAALAALGATRDSRIVEPLRALPWPAAPEDQDLALERARTLVRLGDWETLPALIEGLRDERLVTRALCAQALYEATHERFDFDPRADAATREVAIARWQSWWSAKKADPILSTQRR
jgi:HEAT repeat protein